MEVLERSLYWRMKEEEAIFFLVYAAQESRTAVLVGAWAVPTLCDLGVGLGMVRHGRATAGMGRARSLAIPGSIFFCFLESFSDNYLQNNEKQTK